MRSSKVRFNLPAEEPTTQHLQHQLNNPHYNHQQQKIKEYIKQHQQYTNLCNHEDETIHTYNIPQQQNSNFLTQQQQQQLSDKQQWLATGPSPLSHLNLPPCPLPRYHKYQLKKAQQKYNLAQHKYGVFEHATPETTTITNSYKRGPQHRQFNYQLVQTQLTPQKVHLQSLHSQQPYQHLSNQPQKPHIPQQLKKPQQPPRPSPTFLTVPRNRHTVPRKQFLPSNETINEVVSRISIPPPPKTLAPFISPSNSALYTNSDLPSPEELLIQLKEKLAVLDRIVKEGMMENATKKGLEDIEESDENIESTPQSPVSPKQPTYPERMNEVFFEKSEKDDSYEIDGKGNNSLKRSPVLGRRSTKPPLPPGKKALDKASLDGTHQLPMLPRQLSLPKNLKSPKHFFNTSQNKIIKAISLLGLNRTNTDSNEYYPNENSSKLVENNGDLKNNGGKKRRFSSSSSLGFFNLKTRLETWRWSFTNFKGKNDVKGGREKKMRKRRSMTSLFSSWSSNLLLCTRAPKEDEDEDDGGFVGRSGGDSSWCSVTDEEVKSNGTLKNVYDDSECYDGVKNDSEKINSVCGGYDENGGDDTDVVESKDDDDKRLDHIENHQERNNEEDFRKMKKN